MAKMVFLTRDGKEDEKVKDKRKSKNQRALLTGTLQTSPMV